MLSTRTRQERPVAPPGRPAQTPVPACSQCGRPEGDPLTGLADRWLWSTHVAPLLHRTGEQTTATLLVADVDNFKAINDTAGHHAGDTVLIAVADALRRVTRRGDHLTRANGHCGDEFAALLPEADLRAATTVARRLQRTVGALTVPVLTVTGPRDITGLSLSVGIAAHTPGQSLSDLYHRADTALLQAKQNGRAAVRAYPIE